MPRDPDADELLSGHPDEVAATTQRLRTVLLDAHPQLAERARRGWHSINYRDPAAGFVCASSRGLTACSWCSSTAHGCPTRRAA